MADYLIRETFFRPDEAVAHEQTRIPAALYNGLQLLLRRSAGSAVFIPIRSMQYQAVVDREEVVFVDSHGGYAYQDGEGGRLIRIAWRPAVGRESLSNPVDCRIIYYFRELRETQTRLLGEIQPVIKQMLERQRSTGGPAPTPRVVSLRRPA
jgi:predicted ATPase